MNNISRNVLLAAVASLTIGCVGGLEDMGGTGSGSGSGSGSDGETNAGKALYTTTVHTTIAAKCVGCHQPGGAGTTFLSADITGAGKNYDVIVSKVAAVGNFASSTAPLLTKIASAGTAGHYGKTYTAAEIDTITTWLDKELEIRNPAPTPDPDPTPTPVETQSQATKRLLKEWSGCMTKADFATADMALGVGGWQANNNQECDNCHATAGEGFLASRDATFFFDNLAKHSALIQQYYVVDLSGGVATAKVIVNRTSITNVATRQPGHTEHPGFNAGDGTQGINAITEFYTLTAAHALNPATCEVPTGRLVD